MAHSLFSDGGARGNPGPAAFGALLFDDQDKLVETVSGYLGETTNNVAEYEGILAGLKLAAQHGVDDLKCYLDSELIVMQVNGAYRVKQPHLKEKWEQVFVLKDKFANIKFIHVRREKNKDADALVNQVLDEQAA